MKASAWVHPHRLHHPFGISRGTAVEIPAFYLVLEGGGTGEGSPVRYRNESAGEGARLAVELAAGVTQENLFDVAGHAARARAIAPHHSSARAAFDIALHDRIGREFGAPLHRLFGYARAEGIASTFTIALDTDERMAEKAREAAAFPKLKVKLGRADAERDIATLRAVRGAARGKSLMVDANAGWPLDIARRCIRAAADMGVEYIEQPLAIGNIEELTALKRESPLPIIADEDAQGIASLPALIGRVDGINIKLMKCGGLWEARQMIAFARSVEWRVMLGCMIESSIGIAAASHLATAASCHDLDGEVLISNNPAGPRVLDAAGLLWTPAGPGLGAELDRESHCRAGGGEVCSNPN